MKLKKTIGAGDGKIELQIAPLIDVVFLLLIYFMVTASLIKKEGDIGFLLPANIPQTEITSVPVEILIEIAADGTVQVEGLRYGPADRMLNELVQQMQELRQVAQNQQSLFSVNLIPNGETLHDRVIDVMDACAAAGVKNLTFSKSL